MFTHIITRKWSSGGSSITKSESLTADGEQNRDIGLIPNVIDLLVAFALDIEELVQIYIVSTKDATLTPLDTGGDPMTSIDLKADIPFVWTSGSGLDNPFAEDIGSLRLTNLSASQATVSIRTLLDSTASNPIGS